MSVNLKKKEKQNFCDLQRERDMKKEAEREE